MQVRFIMFLWTLGYNSLGNLTRSLKEKNHLKIQIELKASTMHASANIYLFQRIRLNLMRK